MLDQVVLQTADPMTLNITAADPTEILLVESISGLTSTKVGLFSGDYATEGGYYQGRRPEKMAPVITFRLNPDYAADISVTQIRQLLYRMFYEPQPGADGITVVLKDSELPDTFFVGYTEDINTDQFAAKQKAQVSMLCMEPYLLSVDETTETDVAGWASKTVAYDGSAKAGLEMIFKVNTNTSVMTVDLNGNKIILNRAFVVDEIITINTRRGERAIQVGSTDIMAAMDSTSKWIQLDRPANTIKAYGSVEADGKVVMTEYNFRSRWWGM